MVRALVGGVMLVVASCGNAQPTKPGASATGDPTQSAARAGLAEIRIFFDAGQRAAITIHEDGMVEFDDGSRPLRVTADGKVLTNPGTKWSQTGDQLVASIEADGSVVPDLFGATIHADGTASFRGDSTLDLKGKTVSLDAFARGGHVDGASSPGLRRTAMLVLLAFDSLLLGAASGAAAGP